ncbi:carbohydrate ABC transporter permease [Streptomyces sp. CA-106131]|uniref:carbohydrate ABC transporter permease n=1 Tax=Streptomyces sp. CA-106131 TaxID=3240045 RepID=UPI003D89D46D
MELFEARTRIARTILQITLTVLVLPFVVPLYWLFSGSLAGYGWPNYTAILSNELLPVFFLNSIVIAGITIIISVVCSLFAAFALAKLNLRFKEVFFYIVLGALTMPTAILAVPLFQMMQSLQLFDTYWAVALPLSALVVPFNILIARSFVASLPNELLEAARLDGCSTSAIFWRIIMPLCKPIVAVIVVWTLVQSWNEYLLPLMFLQEPTMQTITLLPQYFTGRYGSDLGKIDAAAVVALLPMIVAYVCAQRFFEKGLTAGAVK